MEINSPKKLYGSRYSKGYSLIEMIIYVALMSIISLLIVNTVLSFTKSYRTVSTLRAVESSALDTLERLSRDIRGATVIDDANSTFNVNPGVLTLTQSIGGISTTTRFYVQGGVMKVDVNGTYIGPLTSRGSAVQSLIFTKLNNGVSTGVKIDLTVTATSSTITRTKNYHTTILLKSF